MSHPAPMHIRAAARARAAAPRRRRAAHLAGAAPRASPAPRRAPARRASPSLPSASCSILAPPRGHAPPPRYNFLPASRTPPPHPTLQSDTPPSTHPACKRRKAREESNCPGRGLQRRVRGSVGIKVKGLRARGTWRGARARRGGEGQVGRKGDKCARRRRGVESGRWERRGKKATQGGRRRSWCACRPTIEDKKTRGGGRAGAALAPPAAALTRAALTRQRRAHTSSARGRAHE
jgi:hypothetical protein